MMKIFIEILNVIPPLPLVNHSKCSYGYNSYIIDTWHNFFNQIAILVLVILCSKCSFTILNPTVLLNSWLIWNIKCVKWYVHHLVHLNTCTTIWFGNIINGNIVSFKHWLAFCSISIGRKVSLYASSAQHLMP